MKHITVLKDESIQQLNLKQGSVVVDCTLGSGGHSRAILEQIGAKGTLIALDADEAAITAGESLKNEYKSTIHLVNKNFRTLGAVLETLNIEHVDAILADLGWRTEQFAGTEGEARGFSFSADEPLKMTFGNSSQYSFTAADIVNDWKEEDIANVIYGYGEDRAARRIARAIVAARELAPITTAKGLAAIVESAVPVRGYSKIHPATKTFQALRIAVNDEFDALSELLHVSLSSLKPEGRLAVISFHSLEDRIVKHTFRDFVHDQQCVLVHKKPITPTPEELQANPRSRSAKLRTIEKLP
jgi:16S rRNA (cytosine1402-N4)-methyltransferase